MFSSAVTLVILLLFGVAKTHFTGATGGVGGYLYGAVSTMMVGGLAGASSFSAATCLMTRALTVSHLFALSRRRLRTRPPARGRGIKSARRHLLILRSSLLLAPHALASFRSLLAFIPPCTLSPLGFASFISPLVSAPRPVRPLITTPRYVPAFLFSCSGSELA